MYFFFFKQKTAYEMRISDWSSDVCSSDLLLGLKDDLTAAENLVYATALANKPISHAAVLEALHQSGLQGREHLPVRTLSQGQERRASLARQIGRASCRERVFQYV